MATVPNDAMYKMLAAGLGDAIAKIVRKLMDSSSADWGWGTVTEVEPGSVAGTVAVDTDSGAPIVMRRLASYATPAVDDVVQWQRNRSGDFSVTGERA
ncbi:hypothetical protein OG216_09590 [Streptomycetaceae bacterium NBC_01309]